MSYSMYAVSSINEEKVADIRQQLDQLPIAEATSFLKAIADHNRSQIVNALCLEEALCVCDIAALLDISMANASSHLRKLYKEDVVSSRKVGKQVYYSLQDHHVRTIMEMSLAHIAKKDE
ncbi:ArsR/SmtB family transcription factor [Macrococcus carouselicus]|uniref:ArsR family transcriptional regulator n=1 Tax=Macrococcus carouselicus TaxID=69969 RepID=A0A9Q8CKF8_9STAP|nr:metalloregulator ArsR/SmtB family transcription factor [Macrococcus carouselicus]TDM02244.1 ArsR family transcriptional regulator [Macrococcus carouselicus]